MRSCATRSYMVYLVLLMFTSWPIWVVMAKFWLHPQNRNWQWVKCLFVERCFNFNANFVFFYIWGTVSGIVIKVGMYGTDCQRLKTFFFVNWNILKGRLRAGFRDCRQVYVCKHVRLVFVLKNFKRCYVI